METSIDKILHAVWKVVSIMNGNPDYQFSAPRFLMALFFLWMLYATIRMRAMAQFRQHQIVALIGCVLMMVREGTMLICMSGWELGIFNDPMVHFLWPPIEHAFLLSAYICFAWYTVEASGWGCARRMIRRTVWWFSGGAFLFSIYTLVTWKQFFSSHFPNIVHSYKHSSVDWQTHVLISVVAATGLLAAWMRKRGSSYLFAFWAMATTEHIWRSIVFGFYDEQSWQATVFHTMHTWAIPLLLMHFIHAYVAKMSHCVQCKRDVSFESTNNYIGEVA